MFGYINVNGRELSEDNKQIYVFNSRSASIGETLIGLKVQEFEEAGYSFEEVVKKTEEYISGMNTFFVLETLETLRKAGRLSSIKAFVANTLNIKPVMGSTKEGAIQQLGQARGMKKALDLLISSIEKDVTDAKDKILGIAHCNCPERAELIRDQIKNRIPFKDILIVNTAGISTVYANDGGIVVCY